MKKHAAVIIGVATLSFALTSCGGGGSPSASNASQYVATPEIKAEVAGSFGVPLTLANGTKYTLSVPTAFVPGNFASGQIPGQAFQGFDMSVTNGSKAALDLSTMIVQGTTSTGNCADIFDGDNNVNGAPQTPLAVGGNLTFKWALTCPGKVGDKFDLVLSVGDVKVIQVTGKLA